MSRPDPIFAAIETHWQAWSTYRLAMEALANARFNSPREALRHAARGRYYAETEAFIDTPIESHAGLAAFTKYLSGFDNTVRFTGLQSWDMAAALVTIAEAVERLNRPRQPCANRRTARRVGPAAIEPRPG